jgi:hypothetical protein
MILSGHFKWARMARVFKFVVSRSFPVVVSGARLVFPVTFYCLANPASAALSTISVTTSLSPQTADFSNQPLAFQQFDSGLGNLKSVRIIVHGNSTLTQQFENTSDQDLNIHSHQTVDFILELPDAATQILEDREAVSHSYSLSAFDGNVDFGGTSGSTTQYGITTTNQKLLKDQAKLAMFTGSGLADIFLSATTTFQASKKTTDQLLAQAQALAGADVTIIYSYIAAAPEPGCYGLSGGVIALVFAFYRIRLQKNRGG